MSECVRHKVLTKIYIRFMGDECLIFQHKKCHIVTLDTPYLVVGSLLQPAPECCLSLRSWRDGKKAFWHPRRMLIICWMARQLTGTSPKPTFYKINVIFFIPLGIVNNRSSIRTPIRRVILRRMACPPPELTPVNV